MNTMGRLKTALIGVLLLGAACSSGSDDAAPAPPASETILSPALQKVIDSPEYKAAKWGLLVVDTESGKTIYQLDRRTQFFTASTAKTFSVSTALDQFGADYRFHTPVVRSGDVSPSGELTGNLIVVGKGDLTLGGRTKPDGSVDVPVFDHFDANGLPGLATITPEDPLAGLDHIAQAVAAGGIKKVQGDVVVDDRLWDPVSIGDVPITPTVVNDNLIDILINPGAPGAPATVTSRPVTSLFQVDAQVTTAPAGSEPKIKIEAPQPGVIQVRGTVNADATPPLVQTYTVPDSAAFARSLFIDALGRAGVTVDAQPVGANPSSSLPSSPEVAKLPEQGLLRFHARHRRRWIARHGHPSQ